MAVKYRSEDLHMAGLSLREEVSRSSEVEIALADGETRARFAELFQNGKTLSGVSGARLGQQIRKGSRAAPSDPASQLMELSQTELFRPADDHGVCTGNVEAALHNIGREENVCLRFDKTHHAIVDLAGRQSAVKTQTIRRSGAAVCTRANIGSRS